MVTLITFILGVIELILGARFFFLLLGANPLAPLVAWVYNMSIPLVAPFAGILGGPIVNRPTTGTALVVHGTTAGPGVVVPSIFDPSTLVALIVYAVVFRRYNRFVCSSRLRVIRLISGY